MAESTESPLHRSVFCIRFSVKLSDLVSSPILAYPVQSSPSIHWTESQRRSLSLAQWKSSIRMRNSYAHMRSQRSQLRLHCQNTERNVERNVDQLHRCSITRTILFNNCYPQYEVAFGAED